MMQVHACMPLPPCPLRTPLFFGRTTCLQLVLCRQRPLARDLQGRLRIRHAGLHL